MKNTLRKAAILGAVAGMRTAIGPAVASHYFSRNRNKALAKSKLSFIQTPVAAMLTKLLGAAEVTTDKLPSTSNRIKLAQTLPRIASGALMGAIVYQASKKDLIEGMLVGGASALAATYASFYIRKALGKIPYIKDPVVGAIEDAFALKMSTSLLER